MHRSLRFAVFKRDHFTCHYCGRSAPDVVLEVDHVRPRIHGGIDDVKNLVTACFDCNRGKRDTLLEEALPDLTEAEYWAERHRVKRLAAESHDWTCAYIEGAWKDLTGRPPRRREAVQLEELLLGHHMHEVLRAMRIVSARHGYEHDDDATTGYGDLTTAEIRYALKRWQVEDMHDRELYDVV